MTLVGSLLAMRVLRRATTCLIAIAVLGTLLGTLDVPHAQAPVPVTDSHITYILPQYGAFLSAPDAEFANQVHHLRTRIGEAPRAKVGFAAYITLDMTSWTVDPADGAAVEAALAGTVATVDATIARAKAHGIPVAISFLAGIRERVDAAQTASQQEDRRNMQWHADNSLAAGWWTHSQYARKQRRIQEAYWRALGRVVANRMAAHPKTFVAATGDGEIELSYEKMSSNVFADYSPFTVAEFRDWLRAGGLYAPGQPLAGHAYAHAARYANDPTPDHDTNGDGHTLNSDFGTDFLTWELKHFHWSLADVTNPDPGAIPAAAYTDPGWGPMPESNPRGFDAPRTWNRSDPWWATWNSFRQHMIWRHNRDVAKWMTTSADPATGRTVPIERWYSHQIPADYLFGHTPQAPDLRLDSSASPWWTADVYPYGSIGITSFNTLTCGENPTVNRTLANVAPHIAATGRRWGILEWNPLVPGPGCESARSDPTVYRQDADVVVQYRPSLIIPFMWDWSEMPVLDTGFEVALRELVLRIGSAPLRLNRTSINIGMTSTAAARTPPQVIRVSGEPGDAPAWIASPASSLVVVQTQPDGRSFAVTATDQMLSPGEYVTQVTVTSPDAGYTPATLTVTLRVSQAGASSPPAGTIDTPAQDAEVSGEVGVTGWAVDDIGIARVEVLRCAASPCDPAHPETPLIPIGDATLVEGARPDVQAASPDRPMNERAGWGYMLLTNMLPNGGNGPFTLVAIATDIEGNRTTLGSRRIQGVNGEADIPFGTLDTPGQGQTVSGTIVNFGWALTQQPKHIPFDGSTIGVYVDGVFVGRPVYNQFRQDIADLFPGLANSNGAVGYFMLDTTTLANGVHTIAWSVTDSAGRAQGIGSRFFTVNNP